MLELKSVSVCEPDKPEIYNGRLFTEANVFCLELIDHANQTNFHKFPLFVKIYYLKDNSSFKKYSLVNLTAKSINSERVIYRVSELYSGDWIISALEKSYNQCIAQLSGLSLFIDKELKSISYENDSHVFTIKDDYETIFKPCKGLKVTFRKFNQFQWDKLSINLNERSSLIIQTTKSESRQVLIRNLKSIKHLLSIFLPKVPKLWEVEYRGKKVASVLHKLNILYSEELTSRSELQFTIEDLNKKMFENWFSKQNILDEISEILIAGRENIVPETRFIYYTKVLELCFKKLYVPDDTILNLTKTEMISEGIWDSSWQIQKKLEKINFCFMICSLWHLFNSKNMMIGNGFTNPYKFLKKVHSSRNYYTHRNEKKNVFTEEELILVNNLLQAFSYGLVLQFLEFDNKKLDLFLKRFLGFLMNFPFDKNEYSIDFLKTEIE